MFFLFRPGQLPGFSHRHPSLLSFLEDIEPWRIAGRISLPCQIHSQTGDWAILWIHGPYWSEPNPQGIVMGPVEGGTAVSIQKQSKRLGKVEVEDVLFVPTLIRRGQLIINVYVHVLYNILRLRYLCLLQSPQRNGLCMFVQICRYTGCMFFLGGMAFNHQPVNHWWTIPNNL